MATEDSRDIARDDRFRRALDLVAEIRSGTLDDEACDRKIEELREFHPHPRWVALMFSEIPDLTDEEVVHRAFEYRAIEL